MAWAFLTEPVFKGTFWGVIRESSVAARPPEMEDESVGSFLQRRLGSSNVGENLVSAVLHGIYAGDIYQLSAKSILPQLWRRESEFGKITQGIFADLRSGSRYMTYADAVLEGEMDCKITSTSLRASLRANPNVTIRTDCRVESVEYDAEDDGIIVCSPVSSFAPSSHVLRSQVKTVNLYLRTAMLSPRSLAPPCPG